MKRFIPILILFITIVIGYSFTCAVNGFHTTTTKIDYNNASKKITVSIKFFTEDIEKEIKKNSKDASFKSSLNQYVKNKFKVKINGATKSLRLTGINASQKTTWGYFEITSIPEVSNIEINNTMLLSFSGQKNIMNFSINGQRKSFVGNSSKKVAKVSF